jgi:hypothetical protein
MGFFSRPVLALFWQLWRCCGSDSAPPLKRWVAVGKRTPIPLSLPGVKADRPNQHDPIAFAGVSHNGERFALQVRGKRERFVIYSVDSGGPHAEVAPDEPPQDQSWMAFSPDGTMIVVGSPLKLTL